MTVSELQGNPQRASLEGQPRNKAKSPLVCLGMYEYELKFHEGNQARCRICGFRLGKKGITGHRCANAYRPRQCIYPLCQGKGGHIMDTCPVMQNACRRCGFRGHWGMDVDCTIDKNINVILQIFEAYADYGWFTRKRTRLIECGARRYRYDSFVPKAVMYPTSGGIERWREFCANEGKPDPEFQPLPAKPQEVADREVVDPNLAYA